MFHSENCLIPLLIALSGSPMKKEN